MTIGSEFRSQNSTETITQSPNSPIRFWFNSISLQTHRRNKAFLPEEYWAPFHSVSVLVLSKHLPEEIHSLHRISCPFIFI